MKRTSLLFVILVSVLFGCNSDNDRVDRIPDGTYTGTFQRRIAFGGGGDIANVTLMFASNTWTGQSDKSHYPALCHGTYKIDRNKIVFSSNCIWTADFNWSLILEGEYDFSLNGHNLTIYHDFSGPSVDAYRDNYMLTRRTP